METCVQFLPGQGRVPGSQEEAPHSREGWLEARASRRPTSASDNGSGEYRDLVHLSNRFRKRFRLTFPFWICHWSDDLELWAGEMLQHICAFRHLLSKVKPSLQQIFCSSVLQTYKQGITQMSDELPWWWSVTWAASLWTPRLYSAALPASPRKLDKSATSWKYITHTY